MVRLEQEYGPGRITKLLQKMKQQSGLAHSRLRHQQLEPDPAFDPVNQGGERLPVSLSEIKVAGVRGDAKRVFAQAKLAQNRVFNGAYGRLHGEVPWGTLLLARETPAVRSRSSVKLLLPQNLQKWKRTLRCNGLHNGWS